MMWTLHSIYMWFIGVPLQDRVLAQADRYYRIGDFFLSYCGLGSACFDVWEIVDEQTVEMKHHYLGSGAAAMAANKLHKEKEARRRCQHSQSAS